MVGKVVAGKGRSNQFKWRKIWPETRSENGIICGD